MRIKHPAAGVIAEIERRSPSWPTLLAWLENDLPDEEAEALHAHVPSCDECREELAPADAVHDAITA